MLERIEGLECDMREVKTKINNLEGWQKTQNGCIFRVEESIDKIKYWMMGVMATTLVTMVGILVSLLRRC
jgi:hypothetical protein